jgi:hypothetical protein
MGLDRDDGWTLMGVGEPRTIHFDRQIAWVADLDGERWIGMGQGTSGRYSKGFIGMVQDPGTLYIFDAEGRVLRDLSPGAGR